MEPHVSLWMGTKSASVPLASLDEGVKVVWLQGQVGSSSSMYTKFFLSVDYSFSRCAQ